ncbi:hypothetical protein PUN4_150113 [Paraburkholderia unamae]|nr:hypothetical protein PUN4_150113 [Paraburkholderia unamae]
MALQRSGSLSMRETTFANGGREGMRCNIPSRLTSMNSRLNLRIAFTKAISTFRYIGCISDTGQARRAHDN